MSASLPHKVERDHRGIERPDNLIPESYRSIAHDKESNGWLYDSNPENPERRVETEIAQPWPEKWIPTVSGLQ